MLNNRIYGLTKGQVSPTSEQNKVTVSTPFGSLGAQISPCAFAVGAEATFVARTVDMLPSHLEYTFERAANHHGVAFVEVYQNCNVFNNGAFSYASDRTVRDDNLVELSHGKTLIFGKNQDKGIRVAAGYRPEVVSIGEGGIAAVHDLLIHDEKSPTPALAFLLSRLRYPKFPEPIGVFRDIEVSSYDARLNEQIDRLSEKMGEPDLQSLLTGSDSWTVT
jgi:2-oxoglutarate ferredoxin oxidoreductase subunit beta